MRVAVNSHALPIIYKKNIIASLLCIFETTILSDGTGVFVLLVYWMNQADLQCKVQMERWDGSVLDTNAACADLGQKCLQIPGPEVI